MTAKKDDSATAQTNDAATANDTPQVEPSKTYYATRDFGDAGTERQFTKGEKLTDVEHGSLVNYAAAGLASTEKPKAAEQPA
ncbi:hypothetical protein [Sphingomonas sp. PB4P5]|uniref:hypothetical protein n=1 Tax=Parasphingomonas puruogangriensis TaxID=3096155 RepID=UPI002FC902A0